MLLRSCLRYSRFGTCHRRSLQNPARYEDDTTKPAPAAPEVRPAPAVVNGSSVVKTEEPVAVPEPDATEGQEFSEQPEQDDDEIDFNLGGGNDYSAPAQQERDAHGPGIKEDG